jgi:hypothetical protein
MRLFSDYYEGKHKLLFATEKYRKAFQDLFSPLSDNWCLPTGSPVVTSDGIRAIEGVGPGDFVSAHDGILRAVTAVGSRSVGEPIVAFRTFGSPTVRLTAEHPVFATRLASLEPITTKYATLDHFRCYGLAPNKAYRIDSIERDWIPAGELQVGDIVWSAAPAQPAGEVYNADFLRLLGWYLAEGSVSDNGRIAFSFHSAEIAYHDEVESLLKQVCGLEHVTRVTGRGQDLQVVAYSKEWVAKLSHFGGRGAGGKKIAREVFDSGPLTELLIAAWLGDGTKSRGRAAQLSYGTISLDFASQMQQLLLREGLAPAWHTRPAKPRQQEAYGLTVSGRAAARLATMIGDRTRPTAYEKSPSGVLVDGFVGYAIAEIGREPYSGLVHNLSVEETESFQLPGMVSVHNCALVVDAVEERLNVEGFRLGDSTEKDKPAWEIWQRNQLDAESQMAHTEALIEGESSVIVWPDENDSAKAKITVERADQVFVERAPGNRERRAALKRWDDPELKLRFATVYLPEGIFKFQSAYRPAAETASTFSPVAGGLQRETMTSSYDSSRITWVPRQPEGEVWPLTNPLGVVPVIPLVNKPRIGRAGRSEIADVIPTQDVVNKLFGDMVLASELAAFRQRWATGLEVPEDPDTHQPIEPFKSALDRLWSVADTETKFGEFSESDLGNYVKAIELGVQHIASQTRTPPHYFYLSGQFPSGEAIKSAETGLVAKTRRKMRFFGESWEEIIRLALEIEGNAGAAEQKTETIWADPESRSEAEHADATIKLKALGIPDEGLWEYYGFTPTQIERFKTLRAEELAAQPAPPSPVAVTISPNGVQPDGAPTPTVPTPA